MAAGVAPTGVEVTARHLRAGDGYAATLVVTGYPAEVGPAWLEPLLSWPGRLDLALHIDPLPAPVAAARLRTQRARYHSTLRVDAARGRLPDPSLEASAEAATDLAERLARGEAKLFRVGLYLTVHARTEPELADACAQVRAAAASVLLDVQPATWRHLAGWTTTLPLGVDLLRAHRTMDTQALAAAFPLASPDLPAPLPGDPPTSGGVLYGINPDSGGIVWWDRWAQENHNAIVLARSGAGKSYFVKLDIARNLYHGVQVAVIDPEDEYRHLAATVGGTVVQLGAPGVRINPFDLSPGPARADAVTRRGLFIHTLIGVLLGAAPATDERAALDRAILAAYREAGITADPATHRRPAPQMGTLVAALCADRDPAGGALAGRLTPWVEGNYATLLNGPTTTAPSGQLVVWSLRQLPDELRAAGTLLALDAIWQSIDNPTHSGTGAYDTSTVDTRTHTAEGGRPVRRMVVVDEAWLLLRDGEGAKFLFRLAKAARKRNAGLTVATQDVADILSTDLGQAVAANSATQILLKQAPQAIDAIGAAFGLTAGERRALLAARTGTGLLLSGTYRVGLEVVASPAEHRMATTTPAELAELHHNELFDGELDDTDLPDTDLPDTGLPRTGRASTERGDTADSVFSGSPRLRADASAGARRWPR
ncbi:VirB4 family type IV secretion system protein [Cryptosporangium phraense]|uniref:DUF87 domain-containing protein n=1 Tax=Cryptosporangium phraense TaxID=2593070 RepID=A0A545ANI2_9ACTN|nr:DUF87 domain-containing protein [Cryptosporangium phraense]